MDLDEILHVGRCRGMDELIIFWRTGFTPDFGILVGYLMKLWTDFDEI